MEFINIIRTQIGALTEIDRYNSALTSVELCLTAAKEKEVINLTTPNANKEADSRLKIFNTCITNAADESNQWAKVKREGKAAFERTTLTAFDELDNLMRQAGIFMVPCGSLEGWLVQNGIAVSKYKSKWIIHALEWLNGNDVSKANALRDFLTAIQDRLIA